MFIRNTSLGRRGILSAISLFLLLSLLLGLPSCAPTAPAPEDSRPGETAPLITPETSTDTRPEGPDSLAITNGSELTLSVGETLQLTTDIGKDYEHLLTWRSTSDAVTVSSLGYVVANRSGAAMVSVQYGKLSAITVITVVEADTAPGTETEAASPETSPETQPTAPPESETDTPKPPRVLPEAEGSPEGYKPAASYEEARERTERGELSGYLWLMDQAPTVDPDRPMQDGKYVRNSIAYFADENTYVVVDSDGEEVLRVYRGGGYITLEEVAAYLYAFGDIPANYVSNKVTNVGSSIWGEYLRGNHSRFSGNTAKYPYEPELPRISGCGGDLQYYEIDIGTTGTDCDPSYVARPYNDGSRITRGAARIVYARFDANGNKVIDADEKYIFYTYNHYNDFREYLNYYNGWGEMFGNITGGGQLSSKYNCNPTPYVPTILAPIGKSRGALILCADLRPREAFAA